MFLVALGLSMAVLQPAVAQDARLPVDSAGRIEVVDLETAREAGLFITVYPGFVSAEVFQAADSTLILEIRRNVGGRLVREAREITTAELSTIRQTVALALGDRPLPVREPGDGNARLLLLGGSTALGVALYGWAIPSGLDVQDSRWQTGLYMLTASGSFIVPWLLTDDPVAPAATELALYGGSRGFGHGVLLHDLLLGERTTTICEFDYCYESTDDDTRLLFGSGLGILEGVGGYLLADAAGWTAGHANAISAGGDWGVLMGLGAAELAGAERRGFGGAGLVGAGVGLALGHVFGRGGDYSYGDVDLLTTPGWIGLYAGASLTDAAGGNNDATIIAAMLAGTAGIVLGDRMVQGHDYSFTQSALTRLGTVAGGLLGLGTAVILDSGTDDLLAAGLSSAGAATGFLLTRSLLDSSASEPGLRVQIAPDAGLRGSGPGVRLGLRYAH